MPLPIAVFQENRQNESQLSWNPWSVPFNPWCTEAFQETRKNENHQPWSPWSVPFSPWIVDFQAKKNNESQQNSQLAGFKDFSSVAGNLDEMQSKSENFVTDQRMIFQNIINENRLKNSKNFRPLNDFTSRKINRKKRKRMHQITNNATVNSFGGWREHQDHQRWSHVPILNWSQSTSPARSLKMNFQNPLQFGSFNERDKNPRRNQGSKSKKNTNVLGFTPEKASRANFKSSNLLNNFSIMGNAASCTVNDSYKSKVKVTKLNKRKGKQLKSSISMNFENEDDIIYLFSVDPSSEDKMVFEIDLESDGVHLSSNGNPNDAANLTQKVNPSPFYSKIFSSNLKRYRFIYSTYWRVFCRLQFEKKLAFEYQLPKYFKKGNNDKKKFN